MGRSAPARRHQVSTLYRAHALIRRREFLTYLGVGLCVPLSARHLGAAAAEAYLGFDEVAHGVDQTHRVAAGYGAQVLLRWGDVIFDDAPAWDPHALSAAGQRTQFGYNSDFIAYLPLPRGSNNSAHGLLCVNHEFTSTNFMWPRINALTVARAMDRERTATEIAAVGHSVVEVERVDGDWHFRRGRYNRRLTADSRTRFAGPAAGHARLRTADHLDGSSGNGILGACAGGTTPWGTVLIAEENFNMVFSGRADDTLERRNHARYGVGTRTVYPWWPRHFPRFDVARNPRAPNHFGWVVELDPYTADSRPVKRTALGRFKHEAANCTVSSDGRVVVYMGDDEHFEYLYKFVSRGVYDAGAPDAARDLLDTGILYVARFQAGGVLEWVPLEFGCGPLTPANGFADQAEVLIEARRAADLVGATHLDRPEDVEANPRDGQVYVLLTNNTARRDVDAANPRANNTFGHILKLAPPGAPSHKVEHAANEFRWEVFALCGDPQDTTHGARYPAQLSHDGWLASPDNCAFDPAGRLWITTDQGRNWGRTGCADGMWAMGRDGAGQPVLRRFFRAPIGAEVCGPVFTPDGRTLFVSVQHPGTDGVRNADFERPATRWPDFQPDTPPPRPSVLAITRADGREIGA